MRSQGATRTVTTTLLIVILFAAPATAQLEPVLGRNPPTPTASPPPVPSVNDDEAVERAAGLADRYTPPANLSHGQIVVDHLTSPPTDPATIVPDTTNTSTNLSQAGSYLERLLLEEPLADGDGDGRGPASAIVDNATGDAASAVENVTRTATNLTSTDDPEAIQENATRLLGYLVRGVESGGDFDENGTGTAQAVEASRAETDEDAARIEGNASHFADNVTRALKSDLNSSSAFRWANNTTAVETVADDLQGTNLSRDLQDGDLSHLQDNATWAADALAAWAAEAGGWSLDRGLETVRMAEVTTRLVGDLPDGPRITDIRLQPDRPVPGQAATVTAEIRDPNTVAGAALHWDAPGADTRVVEMEPVGDRTWQADLPVHAPSHATIAYRIVAWDAGAAGTASDRAPLADRGTLAATGSPPPGTAASKTHHATVADRTPPSLDVRAPSTMQQLPWLLIVEARDPVGSGPVQVEATVDRPGHAPIAAGSTGDDPIRRYSMPRLATGPWTLTVTAVDDAGNAKTRSLQVEVQPVLRSVSLDGADLGGSDGAGPGDAAEEGADPGSDDAPGADTTAPTPDPEPGGGGTAAVPGVGVGAVVGALVVGVGWVRWRRRVR